jgi:hemerythrin
MALQWSDDYSTGVDKVDDQHKAIFGALNSLETLLDKGEHQSPQAEALLSQIVADTAAHFSFEEQCMNRYRCPAAQENERAHAAFLETVGTFQKRLGKDGMAEPLLRELHTTAQNWILLHICHTDIHLKACVQSQAR